MLEKDKELLMSEIKRLGYEGKLFIREEESLEGLEIEEPESNWTSNDLNISHTLMNWRQLPDNAGLVKAWEVLVDSDFNFTINKNMGVPWDNHNV